MTEGPYNPLDLENLGISVVNAILRQDPVPLGAIPDIKGAGVYAIYYTGEFPAYRRLAEANAGGRWSAPIYVGKAVPAGGRRGVAVNNRTSALRNRLNEHAGSIESAENLDLADFYARWLVVEPIWIPLGESLLISSTAPVWNALIDGFGNHDPGAGRHAGLRPRWDVLHTGRFWASKLQPRSETSEAIAQEATTYVNQRLS